MSFKQTLLGMVAGAGMILGSASPAYSQASQKSKYYQPNQENRGNGDYQKYTEPRGRSIPMFGGEESVIAFAIWFAGDRIRIIKKLKEENK